MKRAGGPDQLMTGLNSKGLQCDYSLYGKHSFISTALLVLELMILIGTHIQDHGQIMRPFIPQISRHILWRLRRQLKIFQWSSSWTSTSFNVAGWRSPDSLSPFRPILWVI